MHSDAANIYEQVFECWLAENHIPYVHIDQTQRMVHGRAGVKNFDFLVNPNAFNPWLAEVKGRTFNGVSLAGLKGLDCWTPLEDVQALSYWQQVFVSKAQAAQGVFVFVFRLEQIDIETDGWPIYDCFQQRFLLLAVPLRHYIGAMKPRSSRWQTVTLPAAKFRRYAVAANELLLISDTMEKCRIE